MTQRNPRRTTLWNMFFHYASIVLTFIYGVLMIPLYLKAIPLDLYGAWLATGNILVWLTAMDPGLSTVIQQQVGVSYGRRDKNELSMLLTGSLISSGIISLIIIVVGLVSNIYLIDLLKLESTSNLLILHKAYILAVIGSGLMIFSFGVTAFNQGLQSSIGIGIVYVVTYIASIVFTLYLLQRGVGLLALPIGVIVRGVGLTVGNVGYLVWRLIGEKIKFSFSLLGIKKLARLSSYTFLGRGAGVIASNMDAFVVARYLGAEMAPILSITRKVPDMSRMFVERPVIAFMPAIASLAGTNEYGKIRVVLLRLMRMVLWLTGLIAAGFIVFNDDFIRLWVGSNLYAGSMVNMIIVATLILSVIVSTLSNLCFSLGNIRGNSLVSLSQGLISVPLMFVGGHYWGMLGVALAPLLTIVAVPLWYFPRVFARLLRMEKSDIGIISRETFVVSLTASTLSVLYYAVTVSGWSSFILIVGSFSFVYTVLLGCLSKSFRAEVFEFVRHNWGKYS